MRFYACFSAFWKLTGKANKTDVIRPLLLATGLEGHVPPCAPRLDLGLPQARECQDSSATFYGLWGPLYGMLRHL